MHQTLVRECKPAKRVVVANELEKQHICATCPCDRPPGGFDGFLTGGTVSDEHACLFDRTGCQWLDELPESAPIGDERPDEDELAVFAAGDAPQGATASLLNVQPAQPAETETLVMMAAGGLPQCVPFRLQRAKFVGPCDYPGLQLGVHHRSVSS
ncbi:hypothetical protein PQR75_46580 [Paraburkholderia fungorum]|uniref:hypothetical protein n=1 Tax=Paraburkholderia fungorum TaxID=134537 RepID=UPI0038BCC057